MIVFCMATAACAQDSLDEYRKQVQSEYQGFAREAREEYANFRDRANAEYGKFMQEPWQAAEVLPPDPVPVRPEPPKPQVKKPETGTIPPQELPYAEVVPLPAPRPAPEPVGPIPLPEKLTGELFSFAFYHTPCKVHLSAGQKYTLSSADEKAVANAWKRLSASDYNVLVNDCLELRQQLALCDWAYVKLLQQLTESYFGSAKSNEAVVMQMFILTQSGYKVRIARSMDKKLVLLLPSESDIYRYGFLRMGGVKYYLIDSSVKEDVFVFDHAFPKEQLFSVAINEKPRLAVHLTGQRMLTSEAYPMIKVDVRTNKNLIDFYNTYPLNSNWDTYARASLSEEVKKDLYPALKKEFSGRSESEIANRILNLVQTAFKYATDEEQFGYERPLFGDETIFYPSSDCEDRAILFSVLVRELMGLDVVLLHYPGHLATAVRFNSDVKGDYLTVDGTKYVVCDPTYINARVGEAMPQFKEEKCTVVRI